MKTDVKTSRELIILNDNELNEINGGFLPVVVVIAATVIAYECWALGFCYNLGRD